MTAFNVVRMRVKPGRVDEFIAEHKRLNATFPGMRKVSVVRTGDDTFCIVGEWDSFEKIVAARPLMGGILGRLRDLLEDLGGGLGVTDPVSGSVVVEHAAKAKAKRAKAKAKKPAKKSAKKPAKRPAKKKAKKRR